MSKKDKLILPSNLRPADGEMQISVLKGKLSGIIYVQIENSKGEAVAAVSLSGEQALQHIITIASAMPELRLKIEGEGVLN